MPGGRSAAASYSGTAYLAVGALVAYSVSVFMAAAVGKERSASAVEISKGP